MKIKYVHLAQTNTRPPMGIGKAHTSNEISELPMSSGAQRSKNDR